MKLLLVSLFLATQYPYPFPSTVMAATITTKDTGEGEEGKELEDAIGSGASYII